MIELQVEAYGIWASQSSVDLFNTVVRSIRGFQDFRLTYRGSDLILAPESQDPSQGPYYSEYVDDLGFAVLIASTISRGEVELYFDDYDMFRRWKYSVMPHEFRHMVWIWTEDEYFTTMDGHVLSNVVEVTYTSYAFTPTGSQTETIMLGKILPVRA